MQPKRYFIFQSASDRDKERGRDYDPDEMICSIIDKENIIKGRYKTVISGIRYIDARPIVADLESKALAEAS